MNPKRKKCSVLSMEECLKTATQEATKTPMTAGTMGEKKRGNWSEGTIQGHRNRQGGTTRPGRREFMENLGLF